jgi:hypothetical protein
MHVRFHAVCVKSPSNITVRAKTKCSWDLRHINLTNTQQNYKVLHTRACTSRRITLGCFASHSRKSASLTRVLNTFFCWTSKFSSPPSGADSRPWAYFSAYDWYPFLLLVYSSPLARAKTFPCLSSVFQSSFFTRVCFFSREKKIDLASGRECHTKGWKRDEKGPKKNFQFFSLHVPLCSEFTAHLHVQCTCTCARHHWCRCDERLKTFVQAFCLFIMKR